MTTLKHISSEYQRSLYQMLRRSWQCADMDPDNVELDEDFIINQTNDPENELYFYHTDHLGSSSWITDASGAVNQYLAYLPFGESYIDQRTNGHDIRFKFTGKERDQETGYDYFGARYYSSELSVWLSVDPLADKYPSTSPFMYVLGNPIRYTDPDGRWVKGAGFWRNMFKSDNRINAENRVRELKKQGIDASMSRNRKAGGWDVAYASNESWPADLDAKGSTLSSLTIENFSRKNRNNSSSSRNPMQVVNNVNNGTGVLFSAVEQTLQNTKLGADIAYWFSGNSKMVNCANNVFKYAPYVGLVVTALTGYYLSTEINPATGQSYQPWAETVADIGVNITTIYIGTKYGGWYGAMVAVFYIEVKTNVQYQMNNDINPGMIFIMNKE